MNRCDREKDKQTGERRERSVFVDVKNQHKLKSATVPASVLTAENRPFTFYMYVYTHTYTHTHLARSYGFTAVAVLFKLDYVHKKSRLVSDLQHAADHVITVRHIRPTNLIRKSDASKIHVGVITAHNDSTSIITPGRVVSRDRRGLLV